MNMKANKLWVVYIEYRKLCAYEHDRSAKNDQNYVYLPPNYLTW